MSTIAAARPMEILLVEDNPDDVLLTREAFGECRLASNLAVASSGEEAPRCLRRQGEHADSPRPQLVLLDLNLPGMSGVEVLRDIKAAEDLRDIPVIVLSTSRAEEDILTSYRLHANCFITKPMDLDTFVDIIRGINDFWSSIVALPGHPAEGRGEAAAGR